MNRNSDVYYISGLVSSVATILLIILWFYMKSNWYFVLVGITLLTTWVLIFLAYKTDIDLTQKVLIYTYLSLSLAVFVGLSLYYLSRRKRGYVSYEDFQKTAQPLSADIRNQVGFLGKPPKQKN